MSTWTPTTANSSMPPFPSEVSEERITAWRLALICLALIISGELVLFALDFRLMESHLVPLLRGLHALLSGALLVWLLRKRRPPHIRQSLRTVVVAGLPLFPIFWLAELSMFETGLPWSPFVGQKFAMLAVAILIPARLWVGAVTIVLLSIQTVAFWFIYDLGDHPMQVAVGEPWITLFHALAGFGLLAYRARQQALARDYSRARADAAALERLARVAVAVRDAANTPLQTLEVSASLLESRHPETRALSERISRAVARLKELTQMLAGYERPEWQQGDESFSAEERLKEAQRQLHRHS